MYGTIRIVDEDEGLEKLANKTQLNYSNSPDFIIRSAFKRSPSSKRTAIYNIVGPKPRNRQLGAYGGGNQES